MNIYSKKMLLNSKEVFKSPLYIYNEGITETKALFSENGWNFVRDTTSIVNTTTINDEVTLNGVSRKALHVYTYDNDYSNSAGASVVDTKGVLGKLLKKYTSLNVECSYSLSGRVGSNALLLYEDISGNNWSTDYIVRIDITSANGSYSTPTNVYNSIKTINLTSHNFEDNTRYHIGTRLQTIVAQKGTLHQYITKIWLE